MMPPKETYSPPPIIGRSTLGCYECWWGPAGACPKASACVHPLRMTIAMSAMNILRHQHDDPVVEPHSLRTDASASGQLDLEIGL